MSTDTTRPTDDTELASLRRLSLMFLVLGVVFFALVLNPLATGYFGQGPDGEAAAFVEDNLTALRALFTALGLSELALGVALWLWGRRVSAHTTGRRGTVARVLGWVALVAGALVLPGRLAAWFEEPGAIADDDLGPFELLFMTAFAGFSLAIVGFGILMIIGAMPTWLGVSWVAFGLLAWVGILPFWFFAAALTFGISGVLRFRPGRRTPHQVSAAREPREPTVAPT
jgi:hypothetical protein